MPANRYRYYTLCRPPMPGAVPAGFIDYDDFDERKFVPAIEKFAWGWVEYALPLSPQQEEMYELAHDDLVDAPRAAIFSNGQVIGYCKMTPEVAEKLNMIQDKCWFGIRQECAGGGTI